MVDIFTPARGRFNGTGPIAVIDIGSNSVRLVVYERHARTPTILFNEKLLAGLGRGIAATGHMAEGSVQSAIAAVTRFRAMSRHLGVKETHVIATAAARDAANGPAFVAEVERILQQPVRILDGNEEAYYSALGIIAGFWKPRGIVGDLGGGSLELVPVKDGAPGPGHTFPLGGLRLQEASEGKISRAQAIADESLEAYEWPEMAKGERTFYAVGGTWRSLARLYMERVEYPLHVMHNFEIPAEKAIAFCKEISVKDLNDVEGSSVLSKQRRPLVPFGAVVLGRVLTAMKAERLVISATGVREGLLYEQLSPEMKEQDPVVEAARELALLRSRSPEHADELVAWTDQIFKVLSIEETEQEQHLRHAACLLSDIGWRAHPDYRGEQSLNIISNAAFVGLSHAGRAYLAASVFYRHQGLGDGGLSSVIKKLFDGGHLREQAKLLGALLRIASLLSASMPGILPLTSVSENDGLITLALPKELEEFDGERLRKRLSQFAKMLDAKGEVVVSA
ncbi:Ppx/GppA phosphatase family protein [Roseibium limicola]|uniref:Ppx/GppA family phosphatase n=1 Tax=Roseibium limicola TaxID=2816037 RepID=A0A939EP66_9HYPH|nr:Ppx/GppA phosphatase family protein [Roseibium limicola]MBO0346196.1 Ppx/GppA family phosphatase [Roseibium limicola]